MRTLLLCLLLLVAKASWADVPAARVNGVEIDVMRLERYFTEYLEAQGRAVASIRNPTLYKRLRDQALDELIDRSCCGRRPNARASASVMNRCLPRLVKWRRRLAARQCLNGVWRRQASIGQSTLITPAASWLPSGCMPSSARSTRLARPRWRPSTWPIDKDCKERRTKVITLLSYVNRAWSWPGPRSSGNCRRKRGKLCANVCANPLKWKSPTEGPDGVSPKLGNNDLAKCHQVPRMWGTGRARLLAAPGVFSGTLARSTTYSGAA